jgi:hypothetical protein
MLELLKIGAPTTSFSFPPIISLYRHTIYTYILISYLDCEVNFPYHRRRLRCFFRQKLASLSTINWMQLISSHGMICSWEKCILPTLPYHEVEYFPATNFVGIISPECLSIFFTFPILNPFSQKTIHMTPSFIDFNEGLCDHKR